MEVIDEELVPAVPPPLPPREDATEAVEAPPPSLIAGIVLPVVRAGLRMVQKCEGKLEVLEARLAVAADERETHEDAPGDGQTRV
jgi:hypothetical protein